MQHDPHRAGLERLCRYGLRPAFSHERLRLGPDGKVHYRLRRPWPNAAGISVLSAAENHYRGTSSCAACSPSS